MNTLTEQPRSTAAGRLDSPLMSPLMRRDAAAVQTTQPPASTQPGVSHTAGAAAVSVLDRHAALILRRDIEEGRECLCFNCEDRRVTVLPTTVHRLWGDGMAYYCCEDCKRIHEADVAAMLEWKRTVQHTEADDFASTADIEARGAMMADNDHDGLG